MVLLAVTPADARSPAHSSAKAVSGQLIVGFEKNVSSDRRRAVLKKLGAKVHKRLAHIRAAAIRPRSGLALSVLRRRPSKHPAVDYVERDYILQRSLAPNDPMLGEQSALAATGSGTVGAQTAYCGLNAIAGKGNAEDKDGHGTHVSGIIAARGNNALGVSGLCWEATVMPVKFMNSQGQGSTSDAIAGLEYAIQMGAKIINNSVLVAFVWLALAFWPARVAGRKGHSFVGYFILSLLFFPAALITAYVVHDRTVPALP